MTTYTVEEAMTDRFSQGTTRRSAAYRAGFEEKLRRIIEEADQSTLPFDLGTPEADAYFSGEEHAKQYCEYRQKCNSPIYD